MSVSLSIRTAPRSLRRAVDATTSNAAGSVDRSPTADMEAAPPEGPRGGSRPNRMGGAIVREDAVRMAADSTGSVHTASATKASRGRAEHHKESGNLAIVRKRNVVGDVAHTVSADKGASRDLTASVRTDSVRMATNVRVNAHMASVRADRVHMASPFHPDTPEMKPGTATVVRGSAPAEKEAARGSSNAERVGGARVLDWPRRARMELLDVARCTRPTCSSTKRTWYPTNP